MHAKGTTEVLSSQPVWTSLTAPFPSQPLPLPLLPIKCNPVKACAKCVAADMRILINLQEICHQFREIVFGPNPKFFVRISDLHGLNSCLFSAKIKLSYLKVDCSG